MREMLFVFAVLITGIAAGCDMKAMDGGVRVEPTLVEPAPPGNRQPVLVELFTSEGCSSCPPADRNLAFLEKQQPVTKADVITLAFHVDYWDRLGWKDRFSSPLYTRRQQEYAKVLKLESTYTPQMVVDGQAEFVGSDSGRSAAEISKAVDNAKARVEIVVDGGRVKIKIEGVPAHSDSTVFAAIAEDGISSRVERGENSGMTLEHVSVVRELKTLAMLPAVTKGFDGTLDVPTNPDWKTENLKIVVFVQENEGRKIIAVGRAKL